MRVLCTMLFPERYKIPALTATKPVCLLPAAAHTPGIWQSLASRPGMLAGNGGIRPTALRHQQLTRDAPFSDCRGSLQQINKPARGNCRHLCANGEIQYGGRGDGMPGQLTRCTLLPHGIAPAYGSDWCNRLCPLTSQTVPSEGGFHSAFIEKRALPAAVFYKIKPVWRATSDGTLPSLALKRHQFQRGHLS